MCVMWGKLLLCVVGDCGDSCVTDANRVAATAVTRGDGMEMLLGGEDEDEDMFGEEMLFVRELVLD